MGGKPPIQKIGMGNEGRISGPTNLGDLVGSLLKVFFWLRY